MHAAPDRPTRSGIVLLAILASATWAVPAAAFETLSAARSASLDGVETLTAIGISWPGCTGSFDVDESSATGDAGSFTASLSAGEADYCSLLSGQGDSFAAAQDSDIDADAGHVRASGSQRVDAYFDLVSVFPSGTVRVVESGTTASGFELVFELAQATPYTLMGELSALSAGNTGGALAELTLEGPGGSQLDEIVVATPSDPLDERAIDAGGTLAAGVYTLRARAEGSALSATAPFSFEGGTAAASFDFEFTAAGPAAAPVPLLSLPARSVLPAALLLAGSLLARPRAHGISSCRREPRGAGRALRAGPAG